MNVVPSDATVRLLLHLSYLRSSSAVGAALVARFPKESDWDSARNDPAFIADLNHFSDLIADLKTDALSRDFENPEDLQAMIESHYSTVIDTLKPFADQHKIPVEDFVNILLN